MRTLDFGQGSSVVLHGAEAVISIDTRTIARLITRLARKAETPVSKAAGRHESAMRRVFLNAVKDAQAAVPMTELIDVLSLGHSGTGAPLHVMQPVIDMLLEETHLTTEPSPHLRLSERRMPTFDEILLKTMKSGAKAQPIVNMKFDATNPKAVEWARREGARLVVDVTREARETIRTVVAEGFEMGIAPKNTAKLLRASIGLTERDAAAVMKRQLKLMLDGVDPDRAAEKAERYAEKLTRSRARTIARTETMKAANEGQKQLWDQAREKGLLSADAQKAWIAADPCPICAELDGEVVGIDDDFSIGNDPPAHPNCRCTIGLVQ